MQTYLASKNKGWNVPGRDFCEGKIIIIMASNNNINTPVCYVGMVIGDGTE